MKLTLTAPDLSTAATWAARIAPSKPRVPLTAGVLITATGEGLTFAASDGDYMLFATGTVTGTVDEPGRAIVSAGGLARVAKSLLPTSSPVTIGVDDNRLVIRCGRTRIGLPLLVDGEWMPFPPVGDLIGSIPGPVLARALTRVAFAAVPSGKDPAHLTGILLDTTDRAVLVATDRYRMATAELDWEAAPGVTADQLIVPAELLRAGLDAGDAGAILVHSDGATVALVTPAMSLVGRLHAAQYPTWRDLMDIPVANLATSVTVDTGELARAVAQVSAASESRTVAPDRVKLAIGPDEIGVALVTDTESEGDTAVELLSITGESITVAVSPDSLLAALNAMCSPMVTISLTSKYDKPFLLTPADAAGEPVPDGYRHLLMGRTLKGSL